ncbi:MAG: TA system VapC family ribonuclease toxin [Thermoanaerobaculia bacterium]
MIAVDTNILVYSHREDSEWHRAALDSIRALAESAAPWAIPWPCVHEFLAIVTHPRIYDPPTPLASAVRQVEAWTESPSLALLSESADYWTELRAALEAGHAAGPVVHDARVAALCLSSGVRELWTADRDFGRFPSLRVRNPLVG